MEQFAKKIRALSQHQDPKKKKKEMDKYVKEGIKNLKLKDITGFIEKTWGIQKFHRSKKDNLEMISILLLKGKTSLASKAWIIEDLLFEEEIPILKCLYMETRTLKPKEKIQARKILEEIEKDSLKKNLDEMARECNIPFFFRQKKVLIHYLLCCLFEVIEINLKEIDVEHEENCAICFDEVEEKGFRLPVCECKTIYHKTCLEQWVKLHPSCPTCRTKI